MHIHDFFGWRGPMTHRQYLTWVEWRKQEWNNPDRHDYYIMMLAAQVQSVVTGENVDINKKRIAFKEARTEPGPQMMEWSKAIWFAAAGVKRGRRSGTPEDGRPHHG